MFTFISSYILISSYLVGWSVFFSFSYICFVCVCKFAYKHLHTTTCMCLSKHNLWKSVLSSHNLGPDYQTQVLNHCAKCLGLLNLLASFKCGALRWVNDETFFLFGKKKSMFLFKMMKIKRFIQSNQPRHLLELI